MREGLLVPKVIRGVVNHVAEGPLVFELRVDHEASKQCLLETMRPKDRREAFIAPFSNDTALEIMLNRIRCSG